VGDNIFSEHFARLKSSVLEGFTLGHVPEWIEKNTFIKGAPFSYTDHEYQLAILKDPAREKNIRKCSQIGISEMSARAALAITMILEHSTIIYTLPTATDAAKFVKTRFDPIIGSSKTLGGAINPGADNNEMKQLNQSFIYVKGTVGTKAAISVPADGIFNDEVDFSDATVMSNYHSRLTHSPHKLKWRFSTPTVEGYGISSHFEHSRQHWNMVKCNHCTHSFVPDYFTHVRIPGYDGDIREVTKQKLPTVRYREAYLECPKCKKSPSLQPEHREWVVLNSESNYEAAGYQIQPFDAPNIISIPFLIESGATGYTRYVDFINFGLGLPAEDKETTLSRSEIENCFIRETLSGYWSHVMGIDMGLICHIVVSAVDAWGKMFTVHTEQVPLSLLEKRKLELQARFYVSITVMDWQPYTDMLIRLQAGDPNLYGGVYVQSKGLATHDIKKEEEDEEEGDLQIRQVNINRNRAFDGLMNFVRTGQWAIKEDQNKETIISHMQDMKRVKDFSKKDQEVSYVWRKSASGDDHFHHALLYCWVAAQMRGVAGSAILLPSMVSSFKVKQKKG
jgi:hypothetical protein